jgi:uncharacterized protein (UPF0332 family)
MNQEEIDDLLLKSNQSIQATILLLHDGFSDFSVSRSYYSMFYAVEAILLSQELYFSKHSGVISAFGKNFIKTGILDKKFHQYLLEAFDYRNEGDYGASNSTDSDIAERLISNSKELLAAITEYIKGLEL